VSCNFGRGAFYKTRSAVRGIARFCAENSRKHAMALALLSDEEPGNQLPEDQEEPMTPISVRQLSDGEELVLVEGLGSLGTSIYADPRLLLSERRNQASASGASAFVPAAAAALGSRRVNAE